MHKVRCSALALALLATLTVVAVPGASAERLPGPRHMVVRLGTSAVHAPDSVRAGRYRIEVRTPENSPGLLMMVKPDRGYSLADLRSDVRRGTPASTRHFRRNTRYFGGVDMLNAGGTGALWETLYAGRYWMVGVTFHPGFSVKTVHVHGVPSPSRFPHVSGSVTTTDRGLDSTRFVPQAGRMLIRNTGARLSFLVLLPLADGATYDDFIRWLRHPRRRPAPIGIRGFRSTAALSPGAGYVLRYRMRPGRYVVTDYRGLISTVRGRTTGLRRVVRPVTVRQAPARPAGRSALQPYAAAGARRAAEGWLTARGRSLLERRGLARALPPLPSRLDAPR